MKAICIDSFKLEYLKHTIYLKSLTEKYQHGPLEVPTGFWGGMEIFFKGSTNTVAFFYYSENSSLKWTKYFKFLGRLVLELLINIKRKLKQEQPFLTHNIPLNKLHLFDTSIKRKLQKSLKINFEYLGKLDKIAHKYGTKSQETINYIKKLDSYLKNKDFDLIFSDHGMIDIKEIIKLPQTKLCFLDSTLARYYDDTPKLPLNKGKIIKFNEKYGKTIFLANPGILILPNYWQTSPVKAMHGYSSNCKDMNGFYIFKKPGKRKKLKMIDLHYYIVQNNQSTQK